MRKTWSRVKIVDQFTGMKTAKGKPMSRQQLHMMRKKAKGLCLTCGERAIGVYCLKHTVAARERMRAKLKYQRRLHTSKSYTLQKEARLKKQRSGKKKAASKSSHRVLSKIA